MEHSVSLNAAQVQTALRALEELSEITALDEWQVALLGDLRRATGAPTRILATLGQGRVTYLPYRIGGRG